MSHFDGEKRPFPSERDKSDEGVFCPTTADSGDMGGVRSQKEVGIDDKSLNQFVVSFDGPLVLP